MYEQKWFHKTSLKDPFFVREDVFVNEQKFIEEFDEIDPIAHHICLYDGEMPIATGRIFSGSPPIYHIGRICVIKKYRGQHLGVSLMEALEEKAVALGGGEIKLNAQVYARPFYEKLGYTICGDVYLEEHCPHIPMCKTLPF